VRHEYIALALPQLRHGAPCVILRAEKLNAAQRRHQGVALLIRLVFKDDAEGQQGWAGGVLLCGVQRRLRVREVLGGE